MDPPRTSLCPGYTCVEHFSPSLSSPERKSNPTHADSGLDAVAQAEDGEESEYEEEIEYVVLDLGNTEPTLVPSSQTYRLIGLDTPTPYLQLSGTILQGKHENLLGSELIFTDDKDAMGKKKSVTHMATTSKRISFKEVRLRPKEKTVTDHEPLPEDRMRDEDEDMNDAEGEYADEGDDFDMTMNLVEDVDAELGDALEYVDLERFHSSSNGNAEAGSSRLPPAPTLVYPPPPLEAPATQTLEPLHSKLQSKNKGKGKAKASFERLSRTEETGAKGAEEEEGSPDPAMQIDRLTGISPTVPRASRKSGGGTKSRENGKGKSKGKEKEVAEV